MIKRILTKNKKRFIEYNEFRKSLFCENSPRESEVVFYLLPWLLSINHPACPGYVEGLKKRFKVFNIDHQDEIRKRESRFKRGFHIYDGDSLLSTTDKICRIEGLYTIGSVGTVAHTASSDCDIWICYDKNELDGKSWDHFNQKVNLIKDWMDITIKLPIYFFLCDVEDIRVGNFGSVDMESSGSTQKNVLKEEFYRTAIVIMGKIPLWWVAYDEKGPMDYNQAILAMNGAEYSHEDLIDFGNLEKIEPSEYFGAALWQLQKSLTRPLKSIIKMLLLKIQLDAPDEKLICHQLRETVMAGSGQQTPSVDPIVFTMQSIFDHYQAVKYKARRTFLLECFYLRCDFRVSHSNQPLRKKLIGDFFRRYPMDKEVKNWLSGFCKWDLETQIDFGNRLFQLMLKVYQEIVSAHTGIASEVDRQDMTILGRRIHACYQTKSHKVQIIPKPVESMILPDLTIVLDRKTWRIFQRNSQGKPIVSCTDILYSLTFVIWNQLFDNTNTIIMEPNPSHVTIQEIYNLCREIKAFFGINDLFSVDNSYYLKKEFVTKLMVVVSFERSPWEKNINDLGVIYKNSWGELYVRRFNSGYDLMAFLRKLGERRWKIETRFYLQRNSTYYEKIIERTKKMIYPSIVG